MSSPILNGHGGSRTPDTERKPTMWEYHIYSYKQPSGMIFRGAGGVPDEVQPDLNALGKDGWEVASSYPVNMAQGATNMVVFILKRPVR